MANPIFRTRYYYFNAHGHTSKAIDFVRSFFDLSKIVEVTAIKLNCSCTVKFMLYNGYVFEVDEGFNIGDISIASTALYQILINVGFSADDSYKLFKRDILSFFISKY